MLQLFPCWSSVHMVGIDVPLLCTAVPWLQSQADAAYNRLVEAETTYRVVSNRERELQEDYNRTLNALDKYRVQVRSRFAGLPRLDSVEAPSLAPWLASWAGVLMPVQVLPSGARCHSLMRPRLGGGGCSCLHSAAALGDPQQGIS